MTVHHHLTGQVATTPRVVQVRGMFDLTEEHGTTTSINHEPLNLTESWNIGLIVGPSGSGKSTVANELFGIADPFQNLDIEALSVVDLFPDSISTNEITGLLSSVGFSSPPSWLRPITQLSNGERFRVEVALALAKATDEQPIVIDEFTSVVDRTVAQVGSFAISKHVRKTDRQFIAVACHYDIIDWLQPDWILDMADGTFSRRAVQPRPDISVHIQKVTHRTWRSFARHHYLNESIALASRCWLATVNDRPAAFIAELRQPHPKAKNIRRCSRIVVSPDFQGIGLGLKFLNTIGHGIRAESERFTITTTHPSMIALLNNSPLWAPMRRPSRSATHMNQQANTSRGVKRPNQQRLTMAFEFAGQPNEEIRRQLIDK